MDTTEIRPLAAAEHATAFPLVAELRTHLSLEQFLDAVARQSPCGYPLVGAFAPGLVGVMGLRPVSTLARGKHLHVDDLVVTATARGQGVGEALIAYAAEQARAQGLRSVFLDAISTAVGFYEKQRFQPHFAKLMRLDV